MVASIGKSASPSQGASYYERDGYYAKDNPAHREASRWVGKGAEVLGLSGPVDPDAFRAILEGKVPDGPQLGRHGQDGELQYRPGRDVTLLAPKSVSLLAMVGCDERIVDAHDQTVGRTLAWIEEHAAEMRVQDQDKATGAMIRTGGQKMVAATFRHDASRKLDSQLHTHCVIANMVPGAEGGQEVAPERGVGGPAGGRLPALCLAARELVGEVAEQGGRSGARPARPRSRPQPERAPRRRSALLPWLAAC